MNTTYIVLSVAFFIAGCCFTVLYYEMFDKRLKEKEVESVKIN